MALLPWKLEYILLQGLLLALLSILHQVVGESCKIRGRTFASGETFYLSCKERCVCLGKEYGCISICPQEDLIPQKDCKEPRLITVPGECCKQWICAGNVNTGVEDKDDKDKPGGDKGSKYQCPIYSSPWTQCSKSCGVGIATRVNGDKNCQIRTESKLCRLQSCDETKAR